MSDTIRIPVGPSGNPVAWALIDMDDYERVVSYRWYMGGRGYVFTTPSTRKGTPRKAVSVFLHGFIMERLDEQDGLRIDHKNRDVLDNRKANLRVVTPSENYANSEKAERYVPIRQQARSLRMRGKLTAEIADELGIHVATVCRYCSDIERPPHPALIWTRETVADAFLTFSHSHGRVPSYRDLNVKDGMPTLASLYRVFGSIMEARDAAGLDAADLRTKRRRKAAA